MPRIYSVPGIATVTFAPLVVLTYSRCCGCVALYLVRTPPPPPVPDGWTQLRQPGGGLPSSPHQAFPFFVTAVPCYRRCLCWWILFPTRSPLLCLTLFVTYRPSLIDRCTSVPQLWRTPLPCSLAGVTRSRGCRRACTVVVCCCSRLFYTVRPCCIVPLNCWCVC